MTITSVTYSIERAGLMADITRTVVRDLFTERSGWQRRDTRQTTVDRAQVLVQSHGVISDGGLVLATRGTATDGQIIQALRDDAFRPMWLTVSDMSEPLQ